jgi:hypothetical protein
MVDTLWRGNPRPMQDLKLFVGLGDLETLRVAASNRLEVEKLTDRFAPTAVMPSNRF